MCPETRGLIFPRIRLVIALILMFSQVSFLGTQVASADAGPDCVITAIAPEQGQLKNTLKAKFEWTGGASADHNATWGDGSNFSVFGVSGVVTYTHDYSYTVGALTVYTSTLTVGGMVNGDPVFTTCNVRFEIDDRPTVTDPPTCDISVETQIKNQIDYRVSWTNGLTDTAHLVDLGDGATTGLLGGSGTDIPIPHDYQYVVGGVVSYTTNVTIYGYLGQTGACSTTVTIDDRPKYLYLPLIAAP